MANWKRELQAKQKVYPANERAKVGRSMAALRAGLNPRCEMSTEDALKLREDGWIFEHAKGGEQVNIVWLDKTDSQGRFDGFCRLFAVTVELRNSDLMTDIAPLVVAEIEQFFADASSGKLVGRGQKFRGAYFYVMDSDRDLPVSALMVEVARLLGESKPLQITERKSETSTEWVVTAR